MPACLLWASADMDVRRLLIKIDRFGRSPDELTALLAHELQHALEVASDSGITNLVSFQNSFVSRGWSHGAGLETEEAGKISKRVAAELSRQRSKRLQNRNRSGDGRQVAPLLALQHKTHLDISSPHPLDGVVHSSERHDIDDHIIVDSRFAFRLPPPLDSATATPFTRWGTA